MFLSVVIASERCFCVVSPLRAQRMLSTRTMAVFIVTTSAVLLAGMLVIAGPKHTMACVFDPKTNATSQIVYVTEYGVFPCDVRVCVCVCVCVCLFACVCMYVYVCV